MLFGTSLQRGRIHLYGGVILILVGGFCCVLLRALLFFIGVYACCCNCVVTVEGLPVAAGDVYGYGVAVAAVV